MANVFTREKKNVGATQDSSYLGHIINFLTHPTIWRIGGIAFAIAATIMTGGATIPIINLGLIFGASLIGVVSKALQLRNVDNLKLQKAIMTGVKKVRERVLNHSNIHPRLMRVLVMQDLNILHSHETQVKKPSKFVSALKTFRDIGLENITPIIAAGLTFNAPGLFGYVGAIACGVISSDFAGRVQADQAKAQLKAEINTLRLDSPIPSFHSGVELRENAREEIIKLRTLEQLCKIGGINHSCDEEIRRLYRGISHTVRQQINFQHVPYEAPLLASMVNAINPFTDLNQQHKKFGGIVDGIASLSVSLTSSPKLARTLSYSVLPGHTPSPIREGVGSNPRR